MKTSKLLSLILLTSLSWNTTFAANQGSVKSNNNRSDLTGDIDSLGGNKELLEMARKIKSDTRSRIVQERLVSRNTRLEVGLSYGGVLGGDAYLNSQNIGVQADFHINPRWSVGARYIDFGNSLTEEGKRIFDLARRNYLAGATAYAVDIDYPVNSVLGVVNWYPIYGKTSFLDLGITQFDMYLLTGGGQINLSSGSAGVLTAGAGAAAWITKHLTIRAELRYQNYNDAPVTGTRQLNTGVATLGLGWIL